MNERLSGAQYKPGSQFVPYAPVRHVVTLLPKLGGSDMTMTTLTSREFNQDTAGAKKAAAGGPVFITDRGRPAHVLLSIERYQALTGPTASIADLLAMPEAAEIEFEVPRAGELYRSADLS